VTDSATNTTDPAVTAVEQEVLRADDARCAAMLAGDADALAPLLAERLSYTHSNGTRDTRESLLRKLAEGFFDYREIENPVEQVTVVGDTAMVVGRMTASVVAGGKPVQLNNSVLTVWVREDGDWRLLGYQPTPLPQA
jgi:uncharacterized protein (TIGR02246 family)